MYQQDAEIYRQMTNKRRSVRSYPDTSFIFNSPKELTDLANAKIAI